MARPKPPKFHEQMEFVWRAFIDPCDAPFTVWIDRMWPHLGWLVVQLFAFDLMNAFTGWVRPRLNPQGGRRRRHIGGGMKGVRQHITRGLGTAVSFDPGEYLGERMAGAQEMRSRPMPPGTIAMWSFYGLMERYAYSIMVMELGTEFLYRWTSSVMNTYACKFRAAAVLLARIDWFQTQGIFGWSAVVWQSTEKARNLTFWNSVGVSQVRGLGVLTFASTAVCDWSATPTGIARIRLRCLGGPSEGRAQTMEVEVPPGVTIQLAVTIDFQIGDLWFAETNVHGQWTFTDAELVLYGNAARNL